MLRYLTAGESHGQALVVIVEGLPSNLPVTASDFSAELARRRLGFGRGPRQKFEQDEIELIGGIRHGRTLGSPVAVLVKNTEWFRSDVWHEEMSPHPGATKKPLTQPRPGHADLAGMQKYDFVDARDVLERASARETSARVVAGALAKLLLRQIGVEIVSHVTALGSVSSDAVARPTPRDRARIDESSVRCFDKTAEEKMIAEIEAAAKDGDSLGGVVEVLAYGLPVGLGSHVHWDRKIDGMVVGNTTIGRPAWLRDQETAKEAGGLSGRPLFKLSTRMLAETYVRAEGAFPLIGVGGIDSGAGALAKIRAGADLVQLYSALVFRGLGLIAEIKAELVAALDRGDAEKLSDLVGTDAAAMTAEDWPG